MGPVGGSVGQHVSVKTLENGEKVESHLAEGSGSVKTMIIRVNRHRSPQTVIKPGKLRIKFEKGIARTSPHGKMDRANGRVTVIYASNVVLNVVAKDIWMIAKYLFSAKAS